MQDRRGRCGSNQRDLLIAIRRNYLNVYYRGASLFLKEPRKHGAIKARSHFKYLIRQKQQYATLIGKQFEFNKADSFGLLTMAKALFRR